MSGYVVDPAQHRHRPRGDRGDAAVVVIVTADAVAVVRGGRGEGGRNHPPDRVALAGGVVREADEVGFVYYILIHLTLPSFTFVSYFYNTTGEGKAT